MARPPGVHLRLGKCKSEWALPLSHTAARMLGKVPHHTFTPHHPRFATLVRSALHTLASPPCSRRSPRPLAPFSRPPLAPPQQDRRRGFQARAGEAGGAGYPDGAAHPADAAWIGAAAGSGPLLQDVLVLRRGGVSTRWRCFSHTHTHSCSYSLTPSMP